MRLRVRRTGGFAGLDQILYDVDTKRLASSVRMVAENLLRELEAAVAKAVPPVGADFLRYEFTLGEGTNQRQFAVADDGSELAGLVHQLLDRLSALAPGTTPKA